MPRLRSSLTLPEPVWQKLTTFTRDLERLLPPHPELEQAIRDLRPDAVLLLSRIGKNSVELDVLKVARQLRIPSILLVWSWDNLTSKAVLNEHPDHLLVWNDEMAWEAHAYHGVAPERIEVVGSPLFDRFFEVARDVPDVQPTEPGLLYVGSSPYASDDESAICDEWIAAIRHSPDPRLANARIAIRPHPVDHSWDGWRPPDNRVALSTSHKSEPERLLALIRDASVVVGLNTSAEIEAAIAGRPVVTFRAGSRADGQEGALHFRYLLEANGGFVVDAPDLDAHVRSFSAPPSRMEPGRDQALPRTVLAPGGAGTTCLPDRGREDHRAASDPSRMGPRTHRRWTARRLGPSGIRLRRARGV